MTVCGSRCKGCAFEDKGSIFIPFDGAGTNDVMLVGDSGWEHESRAIRLLTGLKVGTPFSGPSGWWMDKQFERLGVSRNDFTIANAIWCKAPKLGMTDHLEKFPEAAAAAKHCRPYLDDLVAFRRPKVIVPLGGAALTRCTNLSGIERNHAYVLDSVWDNLDTPFGSSIPKIPAIPAFHPSYIMQGNQKFSGVWMYVIKKALAIASGKIPALKKYDLLLDPPVEKAADYFASYVMGPSALNGLICDIETNESPSLDEDQTVDATWQIVRISFSNKLGTAISMPWRAPYIDLVKEVMARATWIGFWNQAFDAPRLRAADVKLDQALIFDVMWMWHWLQSDLPKALGFVAPLFLNIKPWKHLSSMFPAHYSALDSAITADLFHEIQKQLVEEGRWTAFGQQCIGMIPILQSATDKGLLLDTEAQGELINKKLVGERDEIFTRIQEKIPLEAKPIKVYKKAGPKSLKVGDYYLPNADKPGGILYRAFNPLSHTQRKALFTALSIPIPYNKKKDAETIESKHLERYAKKFPVLRDIVDFTEREKLITAYDWPVEADKRVHPEFGFNPTTWRKNARNPNIQTIPKRSDLAKAFRRLFVAAPGNVLIECDSSAIEAVLVGYFAGSERYIKLAQRGVHKWLAEIKMGRKVSKDEPIYDQIKRVVHLSNYMGSPERIAEEYPDVFGPTADEQVKIMEAVEKKYGKGTMADQVFFSRIHRIAVKNAKEIQDFYFKQDEVKDVRTWQASTLAQADYDRMLETPFKQRHYFYNVLGSRAGESKLGNDAKRAIAFMPQATASAIQTRYLYQLPDWMKLELANGQFIIPSLRAVIHDSIVLEVPYPEDLKYARALYETMTAPVPEIGGLSIGAECKVGKNLGEMSILI